MDHSCLLWEEKCDGSTEACLYYDSHQMAWLLMAICVTCKLLNIVCGLFSWRLYARRFRKGETGNGPTENDVNSSADQASGISNQAAESADTNDL